MLCCTYMFNFFALKFLSEHIATRYASTVLPNIKEFATCFVLLVTSTSEYGLNRPIHVDLTHNV
jgi:hypothetical protein